jgi:hypothetical protein
VTVVHSAMAPSLVRVRDRPDRAPTSLRAACLGTCTFDAAAQWHHARLIALESDQDALLELFELAVTWHELEYSASAYIPPSQWMAFAQGHRWTHPEHVARVFSIATDVVMAAGRTIKAGRGKTALPKAPW